MGDKLFFKLGAEDSTDKFQKLFDAVNDESPVPAALVCAAYIDNCLSDLLTEFFIEGRTSASLLRQDRGVIGSFFVRAQLAYCLGLIGKRMFKNIMAIGEIRNIFAHSPEALGFDSPKIAKLCDELVEREPDERIGDPLPDFVKALHAQPRQRFASTAIQTVLFLVMRQKAARCQKRD
jgi:DNA-binding MltR family transcriptional regulator